MMSDLSAEAQKELIKLGKAGKVVTKIKKVPVAADGLMLPKAVLARVNAELSFNLRLTEHTVLWKKLGVRPSGTWASDGGQCIAEFCVPMVATKQYLYTEAWVHKIIKTVGTPQKHADFFGYSPALTKPQAA